MRWTVGRQIVISLLATIPATMVLGGAISLIVTRILGG
jgi:hypothetical protein